MERPGINQSLLEKRYFQAGENSWADVAMRVAKHAGDHVGRTEEFYEAIHSGKFFPSRMTYMGTEHPFASSCFVYPMEDNLDGIMTTLKHACENQRFGGGSGYNFSKLRPKGDLIASTGGEASGPVSFMWLFQQAMEVVHRAGKKHAAQMGMLDVSHPEIFEFIRCKDKEGAFWTFNISVVVTDNFMSAVEHDTDWDLQFGGKVYRTIRARELWDEIVQHAWHNGDPGVFFIDEVQRRNRFPVPVIATNPCGEIPLPGYTSCNLGSIDLSKFVENRQIIWGNLSGAVRTGIRFLDSSLDAAYFPVAEIEKNTKNYRNLGLGVMGWADMLILLGIPYDSETAIGEAEKVMRFINDVADNESKTLGGGERKNVTTTAIAPTGSISMLAGCSSGIEPNFGIVTQRHSYSGSFYQTHWIFEKMGREQGWLDDELLRAISEEGSVQRMGAVPEGVRRLFKTAMEIDWQWHVKHQAAFQDHTEQSCSKTINLPNSATPEDVAAAYRMAYEYGCKSITVYRDGSRQVQVLDNKKQERETCPNCNAILFMDDGEKKCVSCGYVPEAKTIAVAAVSVPAKVQRPPVLHGSTYRKDTKLGKAYITLNSNGSGPEEPLEIFVNVGKCGGETSAVSEAMGRLISLSLRLPSPVPHLERLSWIADELDGIGGRPVGYGASRVRSLPDGIAEAIREYVSEIDGSVIDMAHPMAGSNASGAAMEICPECGEASVVRASGCEHCLSCAYSAC